MPRQQRFAPLPNLRRFAGPLGHFRLVGLAIALVLAASALAMAYLVHRQTALLDGSGLYRQGYGPWSSYQLESEAMRLNRSISIHLQHPGAASLEAVQLRLDILASRLALFEQHGGAALPQARDNPPDLLQQLRHLVDDTDKLLSRAMASAPEVGPFQRLQSRLDALAPPMHNLAMTAQHDLWDRAEEVRLKLKQHQHEAVALAALQGVLLLSMAGIALHKLHQLHQRRNLEQMVDERQAARLAAEEANRAKSAFLANMSHELRTPFHGMLGMLALLERTRLDARQADYVHTARSSAQHLLGILNDILDISKLESGQLNIMLRTAPLHVLLDEVERLMRPMAQDKGLALHVERGPGLPQALCTDGMRLKQILFNLLGNAIKFTPRGEVRLQVRFEPAAANGEPAQPHAAGRLVVDVTDTGPGMDAALMARLFTRFQQGDDSTSRAHGGAGLGLEISRTLARMLGGDITARSVLNQGSHFTLTVGCCTDSTACAEPTGVATGAPGDAHHPTLPALAAMRVLVSEDHDVNQKYLAALFDGLQVQAVFCDNGLEAVRRASSASFDLVLLDVHTPVMDGLQAAREIRALPGWSGKVPIYALTADAFEESRQRALQAGMDGFLAKPIGPEQLLELLARHAPAATAAAASPVTVPAVSAAPMPAATETTATLPPRPGATWLHALSGDTTHLAPWINTALLRKLSRSLPLPRYVTIAQRLLDDEQGGLRRLRQALAAADCATLATEAHSLKGAAATLAFEALVQWATEVETAARHQQPPAANRAQGQLDELLTHTGDALRTLASTVESSPMRA